MTWFGEADEMSRGIFPRFIDLRSACRQHLETPNNELMEQAFLDTECKCELQ